MKFRILSLAGCALALAAALPASAQAPQEGQCIVAGRLNADAQWAPRFAGVQLLGAGGRAVTSASKEALAGVQQARITRPALLSRCDGNAELARGGEQALTKEAVPALKPGLVEVEAVAFPKLRTGGELVELRVKVPLERVAMVKR